MALVFTYIVNFPHMDRNIPSKPAYGVYISQLVRIGRTRAYLPLRQSRQLPRSSLLTVTCIASYLHFIEWTTTHTVRHWPGLVYTRSSEHARSYGSCLYYSRWWSSNKKLALIAARPPKWAWFEQRIGAWPKISRALRAQLVEMPQ